MTWGGKHTIADNRELIRRVQWEVDALIPMYTSIVAPTPDLTSDWKNFRARWEAARDSALRSMLLKTAYMFAVPESILQDEDDYLALKKAINVGGGDTYTKGDLSDVRQRIQGESGQKLDSSTMPRPDGYDPDLELYKKLDSTIKAGEDAASRAAGTVKSSHVIEYTLGALALGGLFTIAFRRYL